MVTPEADGEISWEVAERFRCEVEEMAITVGDDSAIRFTISAGVAQWKKGESVEQLIARPTQRCTRPRMPAVTRCIRGNDESARRRKRAPLPPLR